jgi:hypothetical protein
LVLCQPHTRQLCFPPAAPPAAKERDLAEQQQQVLAAKAEAERKLDAVNARLKAVADREREAEARHALMQEKLESAQAEVAEREAAAAQRVEQLAARERSLKRQEDGLEGLKVGIHQRFTFVCAAALDYMWDGMLGLSQHLLLANHGSSCTTPAKLGSKPQYPSIKLPAPLQEAYTQLDGREQRVRQQEQELADARQAALVGGWVGWGEGGWGG